MTVDLTRSSKMPGVAHANRDKIQNHEQASKLLKPTAARVLDEVFAVVMRVASL